jgi:soluble lytic murein transglycosylase-like protein
MRLAPSLLASFLLCRAFPAAGKEDAALAVVPDSLSEGRHSQAFDNQRGFARPEVRMEKPAAARVPLAKPAASFEDAIVGLIDELSAKDPALFARIRAEEDRIRAMPSLDARIAAVNEGYPRLERALDKSAADGKLSPEGAAKWASFRAQAREALADGTLFERALFAGEAFDGKVQRLLDRGASKLDPNRKLPERKAEYMKISRRIHDELRVPGNSTALTPPQIDRVFEIIGGEYGIRPEFLKYMAKTESGLHQIVRSNPAAVGIMQIETVHTDAYAGERNVANDTITNIVYGGLLRAQTDRTMARRFAEAGIKPPSNPRVVEFLGDLAYNRGPGLLSYIAENAAEQKINVDEFGEYVGGPGGSYTITNGGKNIVIIPGPGTKIDKTGKNSVLEKSSEAVGRVKFSKKLTEGLGDRNGDGRIDHLDVWLTRGISYLADPKLARK